MQFQSILYRRSEPDMATERTEAPEFFKDLNIDQIVTAVTAAKAQYNLEPFFHRQLDDVDDIAYRHEVMKDLEDPRLFKPITSFAEQMQDVRRHLEQAEKLYYQIQKNAWLLDAVGVYCAVVRRLLADLVEIKPKSRGLRAFREYLSGYVGSDPIRRLTRDTESVEADLHSVSTAF
jgi:DNA mismatch repair protein MutS